MDIPKLCYLIMTKEEIKVFIEALELCSEYDKYETMLTKIKTMINNNESE